MDQEGTGIRSIADTQGQGRDTGGTGFFDDLQKIMRYLLFGIQVLG